MHTHRDKLVILTVTELVESTPVAQVEELLLAQLKFNEELEKHSAALLAEALRAAKAVRRLPNDELSLHVSLFPQARDVEGVILRGNPRYEIEDWAKGRAIDNVVVSRKCDDAPDGSVTLGGVSDYLLANLSTNVIVVK